MNKEKHIIDDFVKGSKQLRAWQMYVLEEVPLTYVINNLLKEKFVVEIEEEKYDIMFGIYEDSGIGFSNSIYPSKCISSYDLIEKGFKNGKWYIITNKQLPIKEIKKQLECQYNKEKQESLDFFKELNEKSKQKVDLNDIEKALDIQINEEIKNILSALEKKNNIK